MLGEPHRSCHPEPIPPISAHMGAQNAGVVLPMAATGAKRRTLLDVTISIGSPRDDSGG